MENFTIDNQLDFEDERLQTLLSDLRKCFVAQQTNFAKICDTIYHICEYCKNNYWKAKNDEYYNANKLLAKFGFDKKAISRYKQCYNKFIHIPSCTVDGLYLGFSASKLFELLPLSKEVIDTVIKHNLITPNMTVKQIREHVKTLKEDGYINTTDTVVDETPVINEDEIPLAYNPNEKYEYSYFESMSKNQLLNIVWELQKAYQKLKNKGEKKNDKQSNK